MQFTSVRCNETFLAMSVGLKYREWIAFNGVNLWLSMGFNTEILSKVG